jgi:hypothetical protein
MTAGGEEDKRTVRRILEEAAERGNLDAVDELYPRTP